MELLAHLPRSVRIVTTAELAAALGCTQVSVRSRMSRGTLPRHTHVDRKRNHYGWTRSELEAWWRERCKRPQAAPKRAAA